MLKADGSQWGGFSGNFSGNSGNGTWAHGFSGYNGTWSASRR
jgi:hypothetical protein